MTGREVLPPGYPVEWEADVVLSDGGVARLRPIRPDDRERLVTFYARVSPESKFLRFFAPYPVLTERDLDRFTQVDYVDRVALIITIGDRMVAVGRYDRVENDEAEVAFLVEDSQQGRGVGQLLLEHLAEAARERGITRFMAEVLPQNRRMVQVFADAGFKVARQFEDGVIMVEFPILPTDTSVGVMERREHRAEASSIRRLLTPVRIVALGPGARIQPFVNSLLRDHFVGVVTAVSTDETPVRGVDTVASIADVEGEIDLAILAVSASELGGIVIDLANKGAFGVLMLAGDEASEADARTLVGLARSYGVRALGPDALGLVNSDPSVSMNASPVKMPRPGPLGIFCQSAAVGVMLWAAALEHQVGVRSFISTGTFADVTGNDVMQYWEDDDDTAVCMLSLDRIGNPRKFNRIVRRLARRKPVIVFSPSRAELAAPQGVLPGMQKAPARAVDALFRQSGVIVADRRQLMYDVASVLIRQPLPKGPRVCVVSNSGALSSQVTAAVRRYRLMAADPVVISAGSGAAALAEAVRGALADDDVDSVMVVTVGIYASVAREARDALVEVAATSTKPVVGVLIDFEELERDGSGTDGPGQLPLFGGYGEAVPALAAATEYARWRGRDQGAVVEFDVDSKAVAALLTQVLRDNPQGRTLTDDETMTVLRAYGITVVPRYRVDTLEQAIEVAERLGWNVVLKATAPAVRGRPDLASVHRYLGSTAEMTDAWHDLGTLIEHLGLGAADDQSVSEPVVQAMMPAGVSLQVRSIEDPAIGPVLSLGPAGAGSELLGDVVHRVPPITDVDAAAMVRDLKSAPLLFGRHGGRGVDVASVEKLLAQVAQLADDHPQIAELILTPCMATANGTSVLGGRLRVMPTATHRDAQARAIG